METLKAWLAASLALFVLCSCGTPDTGYKRSEASSAAYPRVRELRHLLLLPPSFVWVEGMDPAAGAACSDTEATQWKIEESVAARLNDWKDYRVIRPERNNSAARIPLARLQNALSRDLENQPFPAQVPPELRASLLELKQHYGVDGVLVVATREVELTAGTFAKTLAITLPTLGFGTLPYVFSVVGSFAEAAIYDMEGNLQWWYHGGPPVASLCGEKVDLSGVFDTLPNARPLALTPAEKPH